MIKRTLLAAIIGMITVMTGLAQSPNDTTQINKVFAGINSVPYCFSGSNSSIFPNYTLGYKHTIGRFMLRTGISGNYGTGSDSLRPVRLSLMGNTGLEKRANIIRNRFFIVFGADILLEYKNTVYDKARIDYYGIGLGPVIGLEYRFRLGKENFSVSSETGFYLMEEVSTLHEDNGRKSDDSRLVSGLHKIGGLTLNYIF